MSQREATCVAIHDEEVSLVEFALHTVYHHAGCSDDRCRFCRERKASPSQGEYPIQMTETRCDRCNAVIRAGKRLPLSRRSPDERSPLRATAGTVCLLWTDLCV